MQSSYRLYNLMKLKRSEEKAIFNFGIWPRHMKTSNYTTTPQDAVHCTWNEAVDVTYEIWTLLSLY